jgi:hypothetical protein
MVRPPYKFFSKIAFVVAIAAAIEAGITLRLGVNPACAAPTAKWVPGSLILALLILSAPGWIGLMLRDMLGLSRMLGYSSIADIFVFILFQFITYYVSVFLVVMFIKKIRTRMKDKSNI